jgi:hypothetical protein
VDIYYTLDGSIPTRHFDNVQVNNNEKDRDEYFPMISI